MVATAVREAIMKEGAEGKTLKSQTMNSHPEYKYQNNEQKLVGYRSSQSFTLDLTDPATTGKFVSAIVSAGSNHVTIDGVNTYIADGNFDVSVATEYWDATADYWAHVRAEWAAIAAEYPQFAISLQGETEAMYMPLLDLAGDVADGEKSIEVASDEARTVIREYVTPQIGALPDRLRPVSTLASTD